MAKKNQQDETRCSGEERSCMNCLHATLFQRRNDPIISACGKKGGDRDVARAIRNCPLWARDPKEKTVNRIED